MSSCPCCSGKTYTECCEMVIAGFSAATALDLMRSRYTAYHNRNIAYILDTTHQKTRLNHDLSAISQWASENTWTHLEIVSTQKGSRKNRTGIVEFKAYFNDKNNRPQIHHERSNFEKKDGQWFFVDGKIDPLPTKSAASVGRNALCPCGSEKKYKHCCA